MDTNLFYFRAGRLAEAIEALGIELRKDPGSARPRTFLFELLCFAGQFDRAGKQLDVLAQQDTKVQLGAALYRSLLQAHRRREELFAAGVEGAIGEEDPISLRINGKTYESCEDEDLRVGCALEVYAGGEYMRIPYRDVEQVEVEAPKTLRDLLWIPAKIVVKETSPHVGIGSLAHLPALAPGSWKHGADAVRLGRVSVIEESDSGASVPYGAKLLICGDHEVSLLEVRELAYVTG
jgi:type VI secretion system protein ImpE